MFALDRRVGDLEDVEDTHGDVVGAGAEAFRTCRGNGSCLRTEAVATEAGTLIRGGVARGAPAEEKGRLKGPLGLAEGEGKRRWELSGVEDLLGEMSRHELILRFTLSHPALSSTIVSTSDIDHLRSNVAIAEKGPLPAAFYEDAKRRLDVASEQRAPRRLCHGRGRPAPRATPVRASQTDIDLANRCRGGCELRVPSNRVWLIGHLEPLYLIGGQLHFN